MSWQHDGSGPAFEPNSISASREMIFLDVGEELLKRVRQVSHDIEQRVRQVTDHSSSEDFSQFDGNSEGAI